MKTKLQETMMDKMGIKNLLRMLNPITLIMLLAPLLTYLSMVDLGAPPIAWILPIMGSVLCSYAYLMYWKHAISVLSLPAPPGLSQEVLYEVALFQLHERISNDTSTFSPIRAIALLALEKYYREELGLDDSSQDWGGE